MGDGCEAACCYLAEGIIGGLGESLRSFGNVAQVFSLNYSDMIEICAAALKGQFPIKHANLTAEEAAHLEMLFSPVYCSYILALQHSPRDAEKLRRKLGLLEQ